MSDYRDYNGNSEKRDNAENSLRYKSNRQNPQVSRHRSDYPRRAFDTDASLGKSSKKGTNKAQEYSDSKFDSKISENGRVVVSQRHYQARGSKLTDPKSYQDSPNGNSNQTSRKNRRKRRSAVNNDPEKKRILAGILVIVIIAFGFFGIRSLLPIKIYINGDQYKVSHDATIDSAVVESKIKTTAGDLVAVDETTVLEEGVGEPYSVILNGYATSDTDTKLKRGDSLQINKGANVMEEVEIKEKIDKYLLSISGSGPIQVTTVKGHNGLLRTYKGKTSGLSLSNTLIGKKSGYVKKFASDTKEKVIALTFDDGPSEYTSEILKILEEYNAKATFFVLGINVESNQSIAKSIVENGNQIALHGYQSVYFTELDDSEVKEQISLSKDAIEEATGIRPTVLRAPYFLFEDDQWKALVNEITYLINASYDSEDWREPGVEKLTQNVVDNADCGAIIQMRDGGGDRSETVEALPGILKKLTEKGYSFVTIDELIEMSTVPSADD